MKKLERLGLSLVGLIGIVAAALSQAPEGTGPSLREGQLAVTSGGSGSLKIWSALTSEAIITIRFAPREDGTTYQQDWSKALAPSTSWTFRIEGKDYILNGEQLKDAIKKYQPQ